MFYLFVPFAVMAFRKFGRPAMMTIFYVASILYTTIMADLANRTGLSFYAELQRQLPGQLVFLLQVRLGIIIFNI